MVESVKAKRDWVPAVAIGGGAIALAAGLYFWMKKAPGFDPGANILCRFKFNYEGPSGLYVAQVWFGDKWTGGWFIHVFGATVEFELPGDGNYTVDLSCPIPAGTKPGTYDAEALIRTPQMSEFDYLEGGKRVDEKAIVVR